MDLLSLSGTRMRGPDEPVLVLSPTPNPALYISKAPQIPFVPPEMKINVNDEGTNLTLVGDCSHRLTLPYSRNRAGNFGPDASITRLLDELAQISDQHPEIGERLKDVGFVKGEPKLAGTDTAPDR